MKKNKGFTLIELLVVIAIIGILASVVLAALSSSRLKSKDAAIKSQLSNIRPQAEIYHETSNNYGTGYTTLTVASNANGVNIIPTTTTLACDTSYATNGGMFTALGVGGLDALIKGVCNSGATSIMASVDADPALKWAIKATSASPGTYYCVDSEGASKTYAVDTDIINAMCQ